MWWFGVVEVVIVMVDIADDICDTVVAECDVGCDKARGERVSMGEMIGMVSESRWDGVGVGIRGMIVFFGHSFLNARQKLSHVPFSVGGRALHQSLAYEWFFRLSSGVVRKLRASARR